MKILVVKGKFTGVVVNGTMVKITCNVCSKKGTEAYSINSPVPGKNELVTAKAMIPEKQAKDWKRVINTIDQELEQASPNAMSSMIVAPVSINGRAGGFQPVVCFYCQQVGLICIESERIGTASFGFQPVSLNENAETHARRRVVVTFITLLALDNLVQQGLVLPGATVVCAGASLQCQGKKTKGSNGLQRQDAHQILRELSINGQPLYLLINSTNLSMKIKNVVTYCHGVISHLDSTYNEADCLVERGITVEMIDLAHLILSGSLRRSSGKYDDVFGKLLWNFLLIRYRYAIRIALIETPNGEHRNVLLFYSSIVDQMMEEGYPVMATLGLANICDDFNKELRQV